MFDQHLYTFASKVVVLGVQETDESGVDGALVRQPHSTVHEDLEDLRFVSGQK